MADWSELDTRRADRKIAGFGAVAYLPNDMALADRVSALEAELAELRAELAALVRPEWATVH
jgi:hypothetical protein